MGRIIAEILGSQLEIIMKNNDDTDLSKNVNGEDSNLSHHQVNVYDIESGESICDFVHESSVSELGDSSAINQSAHFE